MKKLFLLQPRQSGKTSKAIYEYIKDPYYSVYLTPNIKMNQHIKDMFHRINITTENVMSVQQFINEKHRGTLSIIKNIILDEYMFFSSKMKYEIYNIIPYINPQNIFIYTTSDKKYDTHLFYYIKNAKLSKWSYSNTLIKYSFTLNEEMKNEMYELYYNFITDTDTVLIVKHIIKPNRSTNLRFVIGQEAYDIEVNNIWLTNNKYNTNEPLYLI